MRGPCEKCKHWRKVRSLDSDPTLVNQKKITVCTRHPPQVILVPRQGPLSGQMGLGIESIFPPTNPDIECGDFVPRKQK